MINRLLLIISLLALIMALIMALPVSGQETYEDWLNKETVKYADFQSKEDQEFSEFLKAEWENLEAFKELIYDETPKLPSVPIYSPSSRKDSRFSQSKSDTKSRPEKLKQKLNNKSSSLRVARPEKLVDRKSFSFEFLDVQLSLDIDRSTLFNIKGSIDQRFINRFWEKITKTQYEALLAQLFAYRDKMGLSDWGYGNLLHQVGQEIYGVDENYINLFTWFILLKSGYDARVGHTNNQVVLLLPSQDILYGTTYFMFDGGSRKYYILTFSKVPVYEQTSVSVYEGNYAGSQMPLDFSLRKLPTIDSELIEKELNFKYHDQEYSVPILINTSIVNLYRHHPQTGMPLYFSASVSPQIDAKLRKSLKVLLKGKSEEEATNLLLRFVQTAFDYQTDDEQFGREKCLIPGEAMFYGYNDCEDRSVLFAYLVRELQGLSVIGLDYPGHIATAVQFSKPGRGDIIPFEGKRYMVCDPTYINADVGMTMPQFKNVSPTVIQSP